MAVEMSAKIIKYLSIVNAHCENMLEYLTDCELSGECSDSNTNVIAAKQLLRDCAVCAKANDIAGTVYHGKAACEELIDRSKRARENGGYYFAAEMREFALRVLAPIIALLIGVEASGITKLGEEV